MSPKISVVIPAYNEEEHIGRCLESVRRQTVKPYEVIVVDNNSTDRTEEISGKLADRVVFEGNQGVIHALNRGIKAAGGDVVAFMGGDCVADRNWIKAIKLAFEKEDLVGVFGPIYSMDRESKKMRFSYYFIWHVVAKTLSHTPMVMAPGGNCAIRRDAITKVGGYNPDMVPGEDIEISRRLRKLGKLKFTESAKIYASTRRFEENGVWRETKNWLKVFFRMIGRRPKKYDYFRYY
jgi:glycosyltransferase involved in cell wall biosynthesis